MVRQDLVRGEVLVAQGDPSDSLYIVLHGALAVRRTGESLPIAELRAGELVGEIGFFANLPRTANVIAIRDTSVLALTRAAYQTLAEATPAITEALLGALALRFAKRTERIPTIRTSPIARTVALIDGGREPIPGAFYRHMRDALARIDAEIVDPARVSSMFPGRALDASEVTDWLNNLEQITPLVIYLGSDEVPAWTRKAIRQADMVVFACRGDAPSEALTEIEAFACQVHPVSARRIVRIHDYRTGRSQRHRGLARAPALLHASPCRARGPGRYRQPDPLSLGPRDRIRGRRRRQFRIRTCRHLQGVSRARRDVRYLRRHQRRLGDGGGFCQELRGRSPRARRPRDFRQEPQLPPANLAALRAAGSQGVRSRARRSIRRALPDRGLLAAVRRGRHQPFDPLPRIDPVGPALAGGAGLERHSGIVAAFLSPRKARCSSTDA